MIGRLYAYNIDCPDPAALGRFYAELSGFDILDEGDWGLVLGQPGAPRLTFLPVGGYQPPRWPDPRYPQHAHLDFFVDDLDKAEAKVLALGARRLAGGQPERAAQDEHGFRVYADPAGHPFCLCQQDDTAQAE